MVTETINTFINYLENQKDFVFTKFGDGEAICMNKSFEIGSTNCDNQSYSENLANLLIESAKYFSNKHNVFIGEWVGDVFEEMLKNILLSNEIYFQYVPYETLLNIENTPFKKIKKFYKTIKKSKRKKVYVCPKKLNDASNLLNCDIINVPENEAFSEYEMIKEKLQNGNYEIILYSAGLLSKVLIYDLLKFNQNTTHIDIGSGLDNLYVGTTRAYQIPKENLIKIYSDIL